MAEIRRGSESGGGSDKLPWLEPVEDEDDGEYSTYGDEPTGSGFAGVMLAMMSVLVTIAIVTAGVVWFRHHRAATADIGETIHPDPGPYKVKPPTVGGLNTSATGEVAASTSAGEDIDSTLDLNAVPEHPVATRAKPGAPAPAQPQAQPQPAKPAPPQPQQSMSQMPIPVAPPVAKPAPVPPAAKPAPVPPPAAVAKVAPEPKAPPKALTPPPAKPAPVAKEAEAAPKSPGGGSIVQLGAFSTEAKANAVWKSLSSRFHYLSDMTPAVVPVESNGNKLFRLRATGGSMPASQICGQLRIAGETCAAVGG